MWLLCCEKTGNIRMTTLRKMIPHCLAVLLFPVNLSAGPLFDAHLHYNAADATHYSPQQIIAKLERNGIRHAVVTGTPASHTATLYQHAPGRIVPLLGVYHSHDDKIAWPNDPSLPARVEAQLDKGLWRGIGELHIFAKDRHSPVFRRIVEMAAQRRLPLQLHTDPAVIDTVYDIAPGLPVIWAHAGTFPYPDLVADYLQRYPALHVDLSVRDGRIAPDGTINDDWYELFVRFPDRFMIGVDTFSLSRWHDFDNAVATIRQWLAQLPEDVATRLAYDNAAALFAKSGQGKQE
jgi:predicted TIM-barrel fold metal-dependent hydrolase